MSTLDHSGDVLYELCPVCLGELCECVWCQNEGLVEHDCEGDDPDDYGSLA